MEPTVEIKEIQSHGAVVVRATTTPEKIALECPGLIQEVFAYLLEKGIEPSGPAFARYLDFRQDHVDMEVGFPISSVGEPVEEPDPRMTYVELPGGEAAVTWHLGPYEGLSKTYDAMHAWIHERGREDVGAPWEVYWASPADSPDASTWRTEIIWPLGTES